jgi:septal ring factor EnvC (AmiA/AmiB activator)
LLAEAERLAQESRTLLGDLRKLEVERDLQNERARQAAAAVAGASRTLASADARLMELEAERDAQIPELRTRLLDLYKRGRSGNVRLILGATSVRDFARTTRAVAAMARVTKTRLDEHRRLLTSAQQERAIKAEALGRLQSERRKVEQGRAAAAAAIQATTKLLAEIDGRRDLAAQLAGELQVAAKKLEEQIAAVATPPVAPSSPSSITSSTAPGFALRMPVRGGLEWPLNGPVVGRFGEASNRTGGTAPRNGIEIEAGEGAPARAIHAGSVVFASPFPGFGTLVILDHSFGYHSVYGYLDSTALRMGDTVEVGHEVGRVGTAPGRPLALYFELRLDGRSVDPVQWLRLR